MTHSAPIDPAIVATKGKRIGFWLGLIAFAIMLIMPSPEGLSREGWITLALLALMVCWWVSEALPIGITSFLPLVIAPMFGVATFGQAAQPYASSIIFLLLGGFIIGKSIERWSLHERIALGILSKLGSKPNTLIAGFMATAALLSMWISNSATVIMLVPIVLSVAARADLGTSDKRNFTLAALLGTAWAASIGGLGTPVGTPPNLIVLDFLETSGETGFTFLFWMKFGIPVVLIMVPAAYFVLTKWGPKIEARGEMASGALFKDRLSALGKTTSPEKRVIFVFCLIAFFWVFRRAFLQDLTFYDSTGLITDQAIKPFAGLTDSLIAIAGVILLFAVPSGSRAEPGTRLLDWPTAATIPWDILLLFGGGLSLAALIKITGLSVWIGAELNFIAALPTIVMTLLLVIFVIFFTELTSNTATTAALMPIIGAIAVQTGTDPAQLAIPVAMAASCAFMLPMATGPNAVIFGSGQITMGEMAKAGFKLNLLAIPIITVLVSGIAGLLL